MTLPAGLDPRTPVLVGVGQAQHRPSVEDWTDPVELCLSAVSAAGVDAGGSVLAQVGSVAVVNSLTWRAGDPGAVLADSLGLSGVETVYSTVGGDSPIALLSDACSALLFGRLSAALVCGVEVGATAGLTRKAGVRPAWSVASPGSPDRVLGSSRPGFTDVEAARGIARPSDVYPLFETALRASLGLGIAEHRDRIAGLWSRFSDVAAGNPHAWSREHVDPWVIGTPSATNRMVTAPYTKLMNANIVVDQAAALLVCTAELAASLGVPRDRWVFPVAAASGHDHWNVTSRPDLATAPAQRLVADRVLSLAGLSAEDLGPVDLYSCFPVAVQVGAAGYGFPIDSADRPLTVTGGLTFGGGPGNNYVTHSLARLVELVRSDPSAPALATAVGWYLTKHAVMVLAADPPAAAFRAESVQEAADALPSVKFVPGAAGPGTVAAAAVQHDRSGTPTLATVLVSLGEGVRAVATTSEPDLLAGLLESEPVGRSAEVRADGTLVTLG